MKPKTMMLSLALSALAALVGLSACEREPQLARSHAALSDADGDGVTDPVDRCPSTSGTTPVNEFGCVDADQDGVTDEEDACPGTEAGAVVALNGCVLAPSSPTGGERYRPRIVPPGELAALVFRNRVRSAVPEVCPGDHSPPPTPEVTAPAIWSVEFNRVWSPPSSPVTLGWDPVVDDCSPHSYGVEVERWDANAKKWYLEPELGHAKLTTTSHQFAWSSNTWGRYRVWATDANGQSSAPTSWRYFVFATADVPPQDRFRQPTP